MKIGIKDNKSNDIELELVQDGSNRIVVEANGKQVIVFREDLKNVFIDKKELDSLGLVVN